MILETTAGQWLRVLREAAGRTQEDQAQMLNELSGRPGVLDRFDISRWERNVRLPVPYWQHHIAASFGIAETDLAQLVRATRAERRRRAKQSDPYAAGTELRGRFAVTSLGVAVTLGPRAGALARGGRIGQEAVDEVRARTVRLRRLDDYLGGGDTYRLYADELAETVRLINEASYTDAMGKELVSIAAQQAQQAGWAAFDLGDHATAQRLYEASREAAIVAQDAALEGNALSLLSYQLIDLAESGVQAAEQSCTAAGQVGSPTVRALMWERVAYAHAHAGERLATEQALEQARKALDEKGREPDPDWTAWADELEFQLISGRCWAELCEPTRAVPLLESVLAQLPAAQTRNLAVYSTHLAGAYLDGGQVEQAATVLGRALDLAADVASVRPARRVAVVAQRLAPYRANAKVTDLLDKVTATTQALPPGL
jgi:tetratricopeptide (TPR) repeat protein